MKKAKQQFQPCFGSIAIMAMFALSAMAVRAVPITVAAFPISSFTGGIAGFTSRLTPTGPRRLLPPSPAVNLPASQWRWPRMAQPCRRM